MTTLYPNETEAHVQTLTAQHGAACVDTTLRRAATGPLGWEIPPAVSAHLHACASCRTLRTLRARGVRS